MHVMFPFSTSLSSAAEMLFIQVCMQHYSLCFNFLLNTSKLKRILLEKSLALSPKENTDVKKRRQIQYETKIILIKVAK